jgi:hypothetical protein
VRRRVPLVLPLVYAHPILALATQPAAHDDWWHSAPAVIAALVALLIATVANPLAQFWLLNRRGFTARARALMDHCLLDMNGHSMSFTPDGA